MRKVFIILSTLNILVGCSRDQKEEPAVKEKEGWKLVWEDDFNRDDIFSTGIWSKIWGCPTSTADWCKTMNHDPSLFEINTQGKKYFEKGRLEIRCKLEATQGAWPSLWMVPDAPWPTGGEIDIVERLNYEPFVHHSLHSTYTQAGKKDKSKRTPPSTATAPINPDDYNIYAVELDTDEVRFYVNGKQTFSYARVPGKESEGQFPFARPYMLRIDMQLGGKWVGEVKPFTDPVRMYVDWVRFYQKK